MSSKETTLKSCPFCGGKPETWWDIGNNDPEEYREGYNIGCCIVQFSYIEKEDAIEHWNRRFEEIIIVKCPTCKTEFDILPKNF